MRTPLERAATAPLLKRLAALANVDDAGRVLRDFISYLPTQVLPALTGLLVLPLLARKLSPTYLGVVALAQTLVTLGWTLIGGWLATSIIRELPRALRHGDVVAFRGTLVRALGLVAAALVAFLGLVSLIGVFSSALGDHKFLIVAATGGLVMQNLTVSLFAASLRPRSYVVVDVTARTGGYALGVLLVFHGHGVDGYLGGLAFASFACGAVGLLVAWPRHHPQQLPIQEAEPSESSGLAPWLRYGVPAASAGFATWGLAFVDRYLLAAFKDTGAVGVYSVGNLIGDKPISIPTMAFMTAAGPLLITAFEQHGRQEVERLMTAYTRVLLLIGLPVLGVLAAAASPLVRLVAGSPDYARATNVVALVAAGSLVYGLTLIGYTGLIVSKRTVPMLYAAFIGLAANLIANVALIPAFGIVGAAIATPLGMVVFLVASQVWARRHAHWHFPWHTLARAGVGAIAGYAVARIAVHQLPDAPRQLLGAFVGCLVTYLVALELLGERQGGGPLRARGASRGRG